MEFVNKVIVNRTRSVEKGLTFIWKIENFSTCPLMYNKPINSEIISLRSGRFLLAANFKTFGSDSDFVIQINYLNSPYEELVCAITLKDTKERTNDPMCIEMLPNCRNSNPISLFRKSDFTANRSAYLKNDCLTIACEFLTISIKQDLKTEGSMPNYNFEKLSSDLKKLLSTGINSDVNLVVKEDVIKVHSGILSGRSSVFANKLQHRRQENQTEDIVIKDFSVTTIHHFLSYIYTGELHEIKDLNEEILMELYTAADEYAVKELKNLCSQQIATTLSDGNVMKFVTFASQQNDKEMIDGIIEFIVKNKKMISSRFWKELSQINPKLTDQLLHQLVND